MATICPGSRWSFLHSVVHAQVSIASNILTKYSASFCLRLATKSCDVNWSKAKDDKITNHYWNKQAKFLNPGNFEYSALNDGIPIYRE